MIIKHLNLSLEFIQNMSKEEARALFGHGDDINVTQLIRSTILASSRLHWSETRGVREFWYNPIKPILYNVIGAETDRSRKYDSFNSILSEMVKAGILTYRQIGIVDYRTQRELYESIDNANCWKRVILFVEKDSAYVHLQPLKKLLNITILSGGGVSKTACAEAMITNLESLDYKIFTVTDYDPWGFYIGEEAVEKFKILGMSVKESHRIGISPDQVSGGVQQSQMYPVKLNAVGAQDWCDEHGIGPGGLYGLEIEAISGQPGGAQNLRMIVLEAILEHLDEDDRIFEMTEEAWNDMAWNATRYYLDAFTWNCFVDVTLPVPLNEYVTTEAYDMRKTRIEINKRLAMEPGEDRVHILETQITLNEELKEGALSENESGFDKQVEVITEEHIEPLQDEIWEFERAYIFPIRQKINELTKKYIDPIEEQRDYRESVIRDGYDQEISSLEHEKDSVEENVADIESDYDTELSILDDVYKKSRAIFGQGVYSWLGTNKDEYYNRGLEDEDYSMGVTRGFLKEACRVGKTAQDILDMVSKWDKDTPYMWITGDIDDCMDEVMGHVAAYFDSCEAEWRKENE